MTPEQVLSEWRRAYAECHGKPAPKAKYEKGWFSIQTGFGGWRFAMKKRRAELVEMTARLQFVAAKRAEQGQ